MIDHFPSLIEAAAVLCIAFLAGFGWGAGSWLFARIVAKRVA